MTDDLRSVFLYGLAVECLAGVHHKVYALAFILDGGQSRDDAPQFGFTILRVYVELVIILATFAGRVRAQRLVDGLESILDILHGTRHVSLELRESLHGSGEISKLPRGFGRLDFDVVFDVISLVGHGGAVRFFPKNRVPDERLITKLADTKKACGQECPQATKHGSDGGRREECPCGIVDHKLLVQPESLL